MADLNNFDFEGVAYVGSTIERERERNTHLIPEQHIPILSCSHCLCTVWYEDTLCEPAHGGEELLGRDRWRVEFQTLVRVNVPEDGPRRPARQVQARDQKPLGRDGGGKSFRHMIGSMVKNWSSPACKVCSKRLSNSAGAHQVTRSLVDNGLDNG